MSGRSTRVVIVGAGIVGAACADAFTREGFAVTLVDAAAPGSGATAAGMGHLVAMDDSEAQFALTRYSQQLWEEVAPELPASGEYERTGTLWIAADQEEMAEVERKQRFYDQHGVPAQVLSAPELAQEETNLRPGLAGGLLVPSDAVVYPPCVAQWLLQRAQQRGAAVQLGRRVIAIQGKAIRFENGESIGADLVINAAGSLAPRLTPSLDIRPRKGHLVITGRYPGFVRHQLIELGYLKSAHALDTDSVAFNAQPRKTGQVLLGSSRQFGDETPDVNPLILQRMIRRAIEYMPAIGQLSGLRVWTGFRAATHDKLPLIGPIPDQEGLYVAAGHEGLGITTSLGTARLLVDQVLGRPSAIPKEPYLPTRNQGESPHG